MQVPGWTKETLLNQDAAAAEPRSEPRSEKVPNSSETMKKHLLFFCKAQVYIPVSSNLTWLETAFEMEQFPASHCLIARGYPMIFG